MDYGTHIRAHIGGKVNLHDVSKENTYKPNLLDFSGLRPGGILVLVKKVEADRVILEIVETHENKEIDFEYLQITEGK